MRPGIRKLSLAGCSCSLRMTYLGYSTTQVFYGQQLHFSMTRWQGSDGDHELGKCKEFPRRLLSACVPVRGDWPDQAGRGGVRGGFVAPHRSLFRPCRRQGHRHGREKKVLGGTSSLQTTLWEAT